MTDNGLWRGSCRDMPSNASHDDNRLLFGTQSLTKSSLLQLLRFADAMPWAMDHDVAWQKDSGGPVDARFEIKHVPTQAFLPIWSTGSTGYL